MLIYIYAGHVYCEDCAKAIQERLKREGKAPADPSNPWSYHSRDYPKGPHRNWSNTENTCSRYCEAGANCSNGGPGGLGAYFRELVVLHDDLAIIDPWTDTLSKDEYLD